LRVGFIGLGHMGLPMAENLLRAGFELTVFNRTRSKADTLRGGARVAESCAELVEAATLSLMIGGDAEAFEKALPVLRNLGTTVVHLGPSGAGTAAKLANQLLVGVHSIACAEALALAQGLGVDGEKLLQVLQRSWGQSRVLERNGPRVVGGDWGPSATPVRNLRKDLGLIEAAARKARLTLPAASIARAVFDRLEAEGHGESDIAAATLVVARPPEAKS
jgi:3-hydroxyisobutyrate dehydrogenase-like beta-hydroxyacid dehydrogenase